MALILCHQPCSQAGANLILIDLCFPTLISNAGLKLRPFPTASQYLLSEGKHPFSDSLSLIASRRGFFSLEKMSGPSFGAKVWQLAQSLKHHSENNEENQDIKLGECNCFCQTSENVKAIVQCVTPDTYLAYQNSARISWSCKFLLWCLRESCGNMDIYSLQNQRYA